MERLCEMLLPLVKNNTKPYDNLANNVLLLEKFFHLPYFNISETIFRKNIEKVWDSRLVFSIDDYEEELYWPSTQYNLINTESNHLFKYYNGKNIGHTSTFVSINKYLYFICYKNITIFFLGFRSLFKRF